ncbi:hypothetical protein L3X38_041058 [Prunus dulcis]|uniref:Uncharacterized protein n=1 Tax=Prunus dulcis TaxID=3755 RepID=A0AAD4US84_PRUDU|nr:hypothetical protein L3X38_041058 [Prunus dulcis]
MAISFGSMSIGTRPSTNSNEFYDGYGYVIFDYSGTSYGAQDDKTYYGPTSWLILTIPFSVREKLDQRNRNFLWGHTAAQYKVHLVNWDTVRKLRGLVVWGSRKLL